MWKWGSIEICTTVAQQGNRDTSGESSIATLSRLDTGVGLHVYLYLAKVNVWQVKNVNKGLNWNQPFPVLQLLKLYNRYVGRPMTPYTLADGCSVRQDAYLGLYEKSRNICMGLGKLKMYFLIRIKSVHTSYLNRIRNICSGRPVAQWLLLLPECLTHRHTITSGKPFSFISVFASP